MFTHEPPTPYSIYNPHFLQLRACGQSKNLQGVYRAWTHTRRSQLSNQTHLPHRGITLVLSVPVSSNSYTHNQAVSHILHSIPNPQQRSCFSFWVNHACTSALCIDPGKSTSARIVLLLSPRAPGTPSITTVAQLDEMCPLETPRVQCSTLSHALV